MRRGDPRTSIAHRRAAHRLFWGHGMKSNHHDLPGTDPYDEEPSNETRTRRRWPWAAAVVALALAAVGGGIAVAGNMGPAERPPLTASTAPVMAPTASAAVTTTPSPTVATSVAVTPSASRHARHGRRGPHRHPPQVIGVRSPAPMESCPASTTRVHGARPLSPGLPVRGKWTSTCPTTPEWLGHGAVCGLGGACQGAVPYTVLDSVEVDLPYQPTKGSVTPRFAFRALQETDRVTASYGLTSTPAGQSGTPACSTTWSTALPRRRLHLRRRLPGPCRGPGGNPRPQGCQGIPLNGRRPGLHADLRVPERQAHDHLTEDQRGLTTHQRRRAGHLG